MKNLILHLGVHKTATTYIQSRLYNSSQVLSSCNTGYLGLKKTRQYVTKNLGARFNLVSEVEEFLNTYDTMLVSDENILGGTGKLVSGLIYPDAAKRVDNLLRSMATKDCSLYVTIRNPEDYLVSRYCEYLRHYKFLTILEYLDEFDIKNFSWVPLVKSLEKCVGKKINVITFEQLLSDEDKYLSGLTGCSSTLAPADESPSVRRSKLSAEAYDVLSLLARHYPPHMTKKLIVMLDNNKQRSFATPLKPFSDGLSKQLKLNYEKDKQALGLV